MKKCSKCGMNKPFGDFYKNEKSSDGFGYWCKECNKTYEPRRKASRNYHKTHQDRQKKYNHIYYLENNEIIKERSSTWRKINPEHVKSRDVAYGKIWRQENKGTVCAASNKRNKIKQKAMPLWFEEDKVKNVYIQCSFVTQITGIPHQVDHIIPIQGKNVCGLHCLDNLQIIPATENRMKWNKLLENE